MDTSAIAADSPVSAFPQRRWTTRAALALVVLAGLAVIAVVLGGWSPGPLRWSLLPVLVALAGLHYVLAAFALRAAAGHPLPLRPTLMTQFTAAAANRVAPGGIGAAVVNARFLVCQGMPAPRALATVAVLQVAGCPADLLLLLAVVAVVPGGGGMITLLGAEIADRLPIFLGVGATVLVAAVAAWALRRRRAGVPPGAFAAAAGLLRRPRDLVAVLAASAGTTLVLGLAFAVSVFSVPGAAGVENTGALLVAYLAGAGAASVLPLPAGLGSTETALVAVLGTAHVPAGQAIQAVLLFRLITYWLPVPIGLLTVRTLRSRPGNRPAAGMGPRARRPARRRALTP